MRSLCPSNVLRKTAFLCVIELTNRVCCDEVWAVRRRLHPCAIRARVPRSHRPGGSSGGRIAASRSAAFTSSRRRYHTLNGGFGSYHSRHVPRASTRRLQALVMPLSVIRPSRNARPCLSPCASHRQFTKIVESLCQNHRHSGVCPAVIVTRWR